MKSLLLRLLLTSLAAGTPTPSTSNSPVPDTSPTASPPNPLADPLPRLVIYYQTTHDSQGRPISILPLITQQNVALTHLIVCSLHLNAGANLTLNDYPPTNPMFQTLWNETRLLQDAGVAVMGMVGGAAPGSFSTDTLDARDNATFQRYWGQLRDVIYDFGLQGLDIDVEQAMTARGIGRLIRALRAEFGASFVITLAPVASALKGGQNLSGFEYGALERELGSEIAFYNAQFYNGFGSMGSADDYDAIVAPAGGYAPEKVGVGQITTTADGGDYVPFDVLRTVVRGIMGGVKGFGGLVGWEYFNSDPGGTEAPWEWARTMTEILHPEEDKNGTHQFVQLRITKETAARLKRAWAGSVIRGNVTWAASEGPNVDYDAMVNA